MSNSGSIVLVSDVRFVFLRTDKRDEALCKICYKKIKTSNDTTNMRSHLKTNHTASEIENFKQNLLSGDGDKVKNFIFYYIYNYTILFIIIFIIIQNFLFKATKNIVSYMENTANASTNCTTKITTDQQSNKGEIEKSNKNDGNKSVKTLFENVASYNGNIKQFELFLIYKVLFYFRRW